MEGYLFFGTRPGLDSVTVSRIPELDAVAYTNEISYRLEFIYCVTVRIRLRCQRYDSQLKTRHFAP